jgi:hypothetical protein
MIPGFEKIVEERIRQAQKKGEFDALPGSGAPLALEDLSGVAEDLRLAYKILKNADCKPPELEIKEEIRQTEQLLAGMADIRERYRMIKKINFLIMKLNTLRSTRIEFEVPQQYEEKLFERVAADREQKCATRE